MKGSFEIRKDESGLAGLVRGHQPQTNKLTFENILESIIPSALAARGVNALNQICLEGIGNLRRVSARNWRRVLLKHVCNFLYP
jgi:hypothetical protein